MGAAAYTVLDSAAISNRDDLRACEFIIMVAPSSAGGQMAKKRNQSEAFSCASTCVHGWGGWAKGAPDRRTSAGARSWWQRPRVGCELARLVDMRLAT